MDQKITRLVISPPTCPTHGRSRVHRIDERRSRSGAYRLQQVHSAAGCDRPLCWALHGPDGLAAEGDGQCDDPRVDQAFARDSHEDDTTNACAAMMTFGTMMTLLTAVAVVASSGEASGTAGCALISGAIAATCAAAYYPFVKQRRASRRAQELAAAEEAEAREQP